MGPAQQLRRYFTRRCDGNSFVLAQLEILLVCDGQSNFDDLADFIDSRFVNLCICLASDERQRHQGHYGQTDNFVEVSYKEGFHRFYSEGAFSCLVS